MDTLYPDGYIFQQDNAPSHKSRTAKNWFADIGLVVMDRPPMSPDLSSIENLWGIIKNELETMKPMSMSHWIEKINEIWEGFGPLYFTSFMNSMPARLQECIASNGQTIKL
jgi:hypothetical protein